MDEDTVIRSAYRETALLAREKGLTGAGVQTAVLQTAARVATRVTGRAVTVEDVRRAVAAGKES